MDQGWADELSPQNEGFWDSSVSLTNLNDFSSYETNIACLSAVTISSEAKHSPNADWFVVWTARVKRGTVMLPICQAATNGVPWLK